MHVCHYTLAYSLLFLSNSFFFLSQFSSHFSLFLLILLWGCSLLLFSLIVSFCFLFPAYGRWPLYTACREGFLLFYTLTAFVWVWVSFQTTHWPISYSATSTYLCWSCHIPLPEKKILFCLLAHRGIPIQIKVGILSHYSSWHAPSDSYSSFPPLGGMLSQQDISSKRVWAGILE